MTDLTIWLTYHDDSMIGQYNLKEDEVLRLFKGNDTSSGTRNASGLLFAVKLSRQNK